MNQLQLEWIKSKQNTWCSLGGITNLSEFTAAGVYIIWRPLDGAIVRVGQGRVSDRLTAHSIDNAIMEHANPHLLVTWATVEARYLNGVERYLGETLRPLVAERFPDVAPISVNLPWSPKY